MSLWPIFDIFHILRPYLCSKRETLGFYKQATYSRPGDEPFFYFGVQAHDWEIPSGNGPKMVHLGSKVAKHGRLVNVPKLSKRVQNVQHKCFRPFKTLFGPSGPYHTRMNFVFQMDKVGFGRGALEQKNQFLFEIVLKGQYWLKRVPNGQKDSCWPFWSLLNPFGPLWNGKSFM